jgi:dTDP-3-amino-3,4,6-trideoxy-alpha-D-glucopyranose N,N-dimethyltransferase
LNPYGAEHAAIYDHLYAGRGKDYATESAALVRLIRSRLPGAAVICMFSVIGYAGGPDGDPAGLDAAATAMAAHLGPGGVLVVEPWLAPERYVVGHVGCDLTSRGGHTVFRMSHSGLRGRVSVLTMDYLDGTDAGVRHFTDVHHLTLFTGPEYRDAFARAGVAVEPVEDPLFPRGLLVGTRGR